MEEIDDNVPVVPIVPVKSNSHKKKGHVPVKRADDTDKPFIIFHRPPGGVWLSATS